MLQERSNRSRVHSSELPSRRRQSPPKEKKKKSITTHERSTFFLVRSNHSLSRDKTKMNESNCWKKNRLLLRSNSRNGISPCFFLNYYYLKTWSLCSSSFSHHLDRPFKCLRPPLLFGCYIVSVFFLARHCVNTTSSFPLWTKTHWNSVVFIFFLFIKQGKIRGWPRTKVMEPM